MSTQSENGAASGKRLAGRVAIVTGAGTGVGQGIAEVFAEEGAALVLVGRTLENLQETGRAIEKAGGQVRCVQGSIADPATAERAVSEAISAFGRLDIVVNNAHSFTPTLPLEDTPIEDFRTHMDSGYLGAVYFMRAAFQHLRERGGSIINVGSSNGMTGRALFAPYGAAKEAMRALSRIAAREWGKYKIRVNMLHPFSVSKIADSYFKENPELEQEVLKETSLGYMGNAHLDIAPVAVFLASDDSRYVTGETIRAEGGMGMV
jgi:NAD(P)-dependent dehydrogenase (short-subunit alcohol dehydrogenase family)